jgi:phosphopantetheinyl transferase (holo-ACP synthase)
VPLFYQQNINDTTRLGVWKIEETENFFDLDIPLHRDITHPHKRLQHLAGRYLLPFLFSDFPNDEIAIADTRKPFLPDEQYHFSISHCGDYAAAIVSSQLRVGIDIEMVTPRVEKIKHKFLNIEELSFVHSNNSDDQIRLLTVLWGAKEAMFKWWGMGDVDFGKVLLTRPFLYTKEGMIPAVFVKESIEISLAINYILQNELSLAWVMSEDGMIERERD